MDPGTAAIWASGIGAASGIIGGRQQNQAGQFASATAYKRSQNMIVNTPSLQAAGLEGAGLNRILAAGGSPAIGSATAASQVVGETQDVGKNLSEGFTNYQKTEQNKLMKKTGNKTDQDTNTGKANEKAAIQSAKESASRQRGINADSDLREMDAKIYKDNPTLRKLKLGIDAIGGGVAGMGLGLMGGAASGHFQRRRDTRAQSTQYKKKSNRGLNKVKSFGGKSFLD